MDTIKIKGHTATVNGKLVWVPEHDRHIEHALDDDFAALVHEHNVKPIHMPTPKAPEPVAETWTPQAKDIGSTFSLVNTSEGHNKAYKVAVVHMPDGNGGTTWGVVAQWGKIGGTMAQQVKHPGMKDKSLAVAFATGLAEGKSKKGYVKDYSGSQFSLLPITIQGAKPAPASPAPKVEPKPPAPEPIKEAPKAAPQVQAAPQGLDADFDALVGELGVKPLGATPKAAPAPEPTSPAVITTKTEANSIVKYKGAGGEAIVTWKISGMKVNLRVKLDKSGEGADGAAEALASMGAKYMPNAKEWSLDLPGKPWAGGKPMAQAVHNIVVQHIGEPMQNPNGMPASFEALKVGMTVVKNGNIPLGSAKTGEVTSKGPNQLTIKWDMPGQAPAWGNFTKETYQQTHDKWGLTIAPEKAPAVGDTKVEGGKTYILNKNHRWELVEVVAQAPAPQAPAGQSAKAIKAIWNKLKPGETATLVGGIVIEKSKPNGTILRVHKKKSVGKYMTAGEQEKLLAAGGQNNTTKIIFYKSSMETGFSAIAQMTGWTGTFTIGATAAPTAPDMVMAVKTFKKGETVNWEDVKPGMKFYAEAPNASYEIKTKIGSSLSATVKELSYPEESTYLGTYESSEWEEFMGDSLVLTEDFQVPLKVGDTKVENGKVYVLNENHKWMLQSVPSTVPVVTLGENFPFKQVGPQKGSNPGGLYEDNLGQKWYIKFPASEDHAKNELLASKLYALTGTPGPKLKLIKKDGKVGIASLFQEGLTETTGAKLASNKAALDGFGADAWLGNWDSAGASFDNMPVDKSGKAVRIDVGGSLLFRAQGAPKGDAFSTTVPEIDTLRDAKLNPNTASVFGKMTKAQIESSLIPVLEIPDDIIRQAVEKFGPGDAAAKKKLADTLIARKKHLAAKYPAANAIANPPKPDPSKLPVEPGLFPKAPNFLDWQGTGKGLSTNATINEQNQEASAKIYALAVAGNLTGLQALQTTPAGGGQPVSMASHPSQHIRAMFNQCVCTLQAIADPSSQGTKDWGLDDYITGDLEDLSAACKAYPYGVNKGTVPAGKRLGFWMSIADVPGAEHLAPQATHNVTAEEKAIGKKANQGMPVVLKQFMKDVKSSGSANEPYRNGAQTDHHGNNCRDVIKAAYAHAAEFKEGAIIRKHIDFNQEHGMMAQLLGKPKGHVFQNPGSMCCSLAPDWNWSGEAELEMVYAKGAKALYNIGVGSYDNEQEVTTLPGQRFVILDSKQKGPKGKPWFKLLMLPPDPTYTDTLFQKGAA